MSALLFDLSLTRCLCGLKESLVFVDREAGHLSPERNGRIRTCCL